MKSASAKAKGRGLQKWVRDQIKHRFPELSEKDVKSTPMGTQGTDVLLSGAAFERVPFYIEAKARESIAVYKYYDQPKTQDQVLVIIKENYREPLAILDAEVFLDILKELYDLKKTKIQDKWGSGVGVDDDSGSNANDVKLCCKLSDGTGSCGCSGS